MLLAGLFVTRLLAHSGLGAADAAVDSDLVRNRTPAWNTLTHYATLLAETTTIAALAVVLIVLPRVTLLRWRESIFLGFSVAGGGLIFLGVALLIARHRPAVPRLDSALPTSGFPSGHTAASVALYGGLAVVAWRSLGERLRGRGLVWIAATVLAVVPLGVACSRVYLGMHFPSDVLGGVQLLSVSWLTATAVLLLPRSRKLQPR